MKTMIRWSFPTLRPCSTGGTCRGRPPSPSVRSPATTRSGSQSPSPRTGPTSRDGLLGRLPVDTGVQWLKIAFRESESILPCMLPTDGQLPTRLPRHFGTIRMLLDEDEWPSAVVCESSGPGVLSSYDMARFWDNVVLTDGEELSIRALRLVLRDRVSRVAVIGEGGRSRYSEGSRRRVVVRLPEAARPVPLRSLGDGAMRMFGVALALAAAAAAS